MKSLPLSITHKMKSELGNFGDDLSLDLLQKINSMIKDSNFNDALILFDDFKARLKKLNFTLQSNNFEELIKKYKAS